MAHKVCLSVSNLAEDVRPDMYQRGDPAPPYTSSPPLPPKQGGVYNLLLEEVEGALRQGAISSRLNSLQPCSWGPAQDTMMWGSGVETAGVSQVILDANAMQGFETMGCKS